MSSNKKLIVVSNEKLSVDENRFYCDNIDIKSIPEGLQKNFEIIMIAKKSKLKRYYQINLKNIYSSGNIFSYLLNIFKTFKYKNVNYFLISITPYTFVASLILFIFGKKTYVYLRSNGYEEYKAILGILGPLIYYFMFSFVTFRSKIISCQKRLVKKNNYDLVYPSELDEKWLKDHKEAQVVEPKLLYVGRIKVEKGFYSLLKIFKEIKYNIKFSVVGKSESLEKKENKINFLGFKNNVAELIKVYDDHNITILPSFTEAHPKVVDESLARMRPVIIFEDIEHIKKNKQGIFVAKRNSKSLLETIYFITNNYKNIQKEMKKNQLPTKSQFILDLSKILS